jgi:hypothetical protein
MKAAHDLLLSLSTQLPPFGRRRHCLTLSDQGDLVVSVVVGKNGWRSIVIEPEGFEKDPTTVASEIIALASSAQANDAEGESF